MEPWLRFSSGKFINIRCSNDIAAKFPEGCHIAASNSAGVLTITMLNRVGGSAFYKDRAERGHDHQSHLVVANKPEFNLPKFGAVNPEEMVEVTGGLQLIMPAELPALRDTGPRAKRQPKAPAPAKEAQPAPQQPPAPPAVPAAAPAPQKTAPPALDLRAAVRAINDWKAFLGSDMDLEILADGTLQARALYQ